MFSTLGGVGCDCVDQRGIEAFYSSDIVWSSLQLEVIPLMIFPFGCLDWTDTMYIVIFNFLHTNYR